MIVAVVDLRRALAARRSPSPLALFLLALVHARPPHPARARQQRHRVLDHLEPHHAADRRGAADLRDVPAARPARHPQVALIATYTAVNLPIVVWLTRDFFAGIPIDLEESAELDGASKFRVFFTIALPLVRSGLVATFLLVLILAWNEYLLALFLSNANAQTMPVLVSAQNTTRGPQWWNMSVLIVVMIAPVVVIASVLQKHIARGLLVGAVKG